jgi:hypothetical protein
MNSFLVKDFNNLCNNFFKKIQNFCNDSKLIGVWFGWLESLENDAIKELKKSLLQQRYPSTRGKRSLLHKSERQKATKKNIKNQCLFSSSLLQKSERRKE